MRAAGAETAALGEGVLDRSLESLRAQGAEASTGGGAADVGRGHTSPGGGGGPGGIPEPATKGQSVEALTTEAGLTRGRPTATDSTTGGAPGVPLPDGGDPDHDEEEEDDLPPILTDPEGDAEYWVDDWLGAD